MSGPADIDVERALLGSILAYHGTLDLVIGEVPDLDPNDFFLESHKQIWKAVKNLGGTADLVTVAEKLRGLPSGGPSYLSELADAAGTAVNAPFYARKVKDMSTKRKLAAVAQRIEHIYSNTDGTAEDAIDAAEAAIQALRSGSGGGDGLTRLGDSEISENLKQIEERSQGKSENVAIPAGFTDVDRMVGGFHPSDLVILAGRPSMGKTALALALIVNATLPFFRESGRGQQITDVAFFSLEMSRDQVFNRLLAMLSGIDSAVIRSGVGLRPADFGGLAGAADYIQRAGIWIDDRGGQTDAEIVRKTKRLQASLAKEQRSIGLVVVDYLQLMRSARKTDRRDLEVSEISMALKSLAKTLGATVVALSQLNRQVEARTDKKPLLSDLRESGTLEQDADVVAMLYRPGYYSGDLQDRSCEILIRKNRNGPTGTCRTWVDLTTGKFRTAEQVAYK